MGEFITLAEKHLLNGRTIRYRLRQDEKGYYFEGMDKKSFRRASRASMEKRANHFGFDVIDYERPTDTQAEQYRDDIENGLI